MVDGFWGGIINSRKHLEEEDSLFSGSGCLQVDDPSSVYIWLTTTEKERERKNERNFGGGVLKVGEVGWGDWGMYYKYNFQVMNY